MEKKFVVISLAFLVVIGVIIALKTCFNAAVDSRVASMMNRSEASIVFPYDNLEQIIEATPNILQCKVKSKGTSFKYEDINFVKTDIQITDCLRSIDGITVGQTLSILQTDGIDTLLEKGDAILYVEKYVGPVTNNAYVIVGYDYGQNIISGKSIRHATAHIDKVKSIAADFESIDKLKEKIKSTPYKPKTAIKNSQETIKAINDSEKLKEQQSINN